MGFTGADFRSENTDGIPSVGTLGLGSEPRRAARLAGGTLNGLGGGGARARAGEGRSWEPCARVGSLLTTAS